MSLLQELDKAKAWLDGVRPLPNDVLTELAHRFEVSLTHHSTAIEGNTLTRSETQIVIEKGITIGGKSLTDHLEVIGHKEALDFVIELAAENALITERVIREIHSLVVKGQMDDDRGRYRSLDVKAAGTDYNYPSHLKVPELMESFVDWLSHPTTHHPVEFAAEAHLRFVTIHPFRDGNGRVGRLLMNLLLVKEGFPIAILKVNDRANYIASLESAQEGNGRNKLDDLVQKAVKQSLIDTLETALSSESTKAESSLKSEATAWIIENTAPKQNQ